MKNPQRFHTMTFAFAFCSSRPVLIFLSLKFLHSENYIQSSMCLLPSSRRRFAVHTWCSLSWDSRWVCTLAALRLCVCICSGIREYLQLMKLISWFSWQSIQKDEKFKNFHDIVILKAVSTIINPIWTELKIREGAMNISVCNGKESF